MKGAIRITRPAKPFTWGMLMIVPLIFTAIGQASAQSWVELFPDGGSPGARVAHVAAYDPVSKRMIVHGGGRLGFGPTFNDTWVLLGADGTSGTPEWVELAPIGPLPPAFDFPAVGHDAESNRLIVVPRNSSNIWILKHANGLGGLPEWVSFLTPERFTPGFTGPAVYDSSTNRLITHGGCCPSTSDVWILENANGLPGTPHWMLLPVAGVSPPARDFHTAVYDATSGRMIIFGGTTEGGGGIFNDVWVLENANGVGGTPEWIQLNPTGGPPSVRSFHTAVYDAVRKRMIIFAGCCFHNDVWVLTNANGLGGQPEWIQLFPSGDPGSRRFHSAIFDPQTNRMVTFGGDAGGDTNQLWALNSANGLVETPVAIDIKPGSDPNSINPRSRGVIPVAVLTTGTFDPTAVDPKTVRFGATGTEAAPVHAALEDVNGDGKLDMILHFNTQLTGITCGTTSGSLTGKTSSGQAIQGSDSIKTVGCK